jgi:hypothetical protein
VDAFSRVAVGYHGCTRELATQLLNGDLSIWRPSRNAWDWLGHGIYFWEQGLERALRWAEEKYAGTGREPAVIGACIELDRCFDVTDERYTRMLHDGYLWLKAEYEAHGKSLPTNRGGPDRGRRELDCLVINTVLERSAPPGLFTSVRAPFLEGPEAYPGSMLRKYTHIQIAVRSLTCISNVFMPNLDRDPR